MKIKTTTIGSYPKPDYVSTPDWFHYNRTNIRHELTDAYTDYLSRLDKKEEQLLDKAVAKVIQDQVEAGIDIVTDGELRREHYIFYHCRHIEGVDFENLTPKNMRSGGWVGKVPTIRAKFKAGAPFLVRDFQVARKSLQNLGSSKATQVKMTIPGPMTIAGSMADDYYYDEKKLGEDWADTVNVEINRLVEAGCKWIQIDEPLFARKPKDALAFGVDNLQRCFNGVPREVLRVMHMCCGYPSKLDDEDYPKADRRAYFDLAAAVDNAVDAVSIEDAHRYNDLKLLELFNNATVILGVVAIAESRVEAVGEIRTRLEQALEHIDRERLMAAPDCGLAMLPVEVAREKMSSLVQAANLV